MARMARAPLPFPVNSPRFKLSKFHFEFNPVAEQAPPPSVSTRPPRSHAGDELDPKETGSELKCWGKGTIDTPVYTLRLHPLPLAAKVRSDQQGIEKQKVN